MWGRRPRVDYSQLPTSPPNWEAVQEQQAAERVRIHQEWKLFIANEVLPCINAALYSATSVEYRPRMLTVAGNQRKVRVSNIEHDITWVKYLLAALNSNPAYQRYKISFIGVRNTGAHWRSGGPFHEFIPLSTDDLHKSAQDFIKSSIWHPYFQVSIEL